MTIWKVRVYMRRVVGGVAAIWKVRVYMKRVVGVVGADMEGDSVHGVCCWWCGCRYGR